MTILAAMVERSQRLPEQVLMHLAADGEILGYYLDADSAPKGCIAISAEQWQDQLALTASHIVDGLPVRQSRAQDEALARVLERQWRDNELSYTDRFMLADYPISVEARAAVISYRQALRDMPQTGVKPVRPVWM